MGERCRISVCVHHERKIEIFSFSAMAHMWSFVVIVSLRPKRVDRCEIIFPRRQVQVVCPEDDILSKELCGSFVITEGIPQSSDEADR